MVALALREADELCVCDLAWILERAQNLVSHHLRALRVEGLVGYRREGKMALYSLTPPGRELLELVAAGASESVGRD
jgi:DNA-binding transcriptional ArsR family regulator